jgi:hypothetical protein
MPSTASKYSRLSSLMRGASSSNLTLVTDFKKISTNHAAAGQQNTKFNIMKKLKNTAQAP